MERNPFSKESETKILQSIYFAYDVGIISSYSNRILITTTIFRVCLNYLYVIVYISILWFITSRAILNLAYPFLE